MIKPTPKQRRKKLCKGCREYYRPSANDPSFKSWCSDDCGVLIATKNFKRIKRDEEIASDKARKKRKADFYQKDIKTRREAAVRECNKYILLRDAGKPCISCGAPWNSCKFSAGHYITAGSCTALRFDPRNIYGQCWYNCNKNRSGNIVEARKGIIERCGQEVMDFLEGPQPTVKVSAQFYREIEDKFKKLNKELA